MGNEPVKAPEKSVKEQIREQRRAINRSARAIEREKKKCEDDEKKMKIELKKMAKAGQHGSAKLIAKDIVRIRGQCAKMTQFVGQLKALELRIGSLASLNELSSAMETAAAAMQTVSNKIDTKKLMDMAKIMEKEDAKLDMKSEMMSDILDNIGESMDDPEETEKIYKGVLLEVGMQVENEMPEAKTDKVVQGGKREEDDLDKMLNEIKK